MQDKLIVKQYKIILDDFDLEMVKEISEEMKHDLYALPLDGGDNPRYFKTDN